MKLHKGICWGVVALAVSLPGLSSAFAATDGPVVRASEINKVLQSKKASWTAKDSWVTRLSKAEVKRLLGAPTVEPEDSGFAPVEKAAQKGAADLDWRNNNG